jgi:hypothetical protein
MREEIGFFKGLLSVGYMFCLLGAFGWAVYQWGYKNGGEAEMGQVYQAAAKLQHCNRVLVGDK